MKLLSATSVRQSEVATVFCFQDESSLKKSITELHAQFSLPVFSMATHKEFSGKEGESLLLYTNDNKNPRLLLVGLGEEKNISLETIRRAAAVAAKKAKSLKVRSLTLHAISAKNYTTEEIAIAMSEAVLLSTYKFDKYISNGKNGDILASVTFIPASAREKKMFDRGMKIGEALAQGTLYARNLTNAPGNEIYPETLASNIQSLGKKLGFAVTVFDKRKIQSLGMGGIIGVSKGSEKEPRFIIMEYGRQHKKNGTVVLVGKGVTFDTGGISIKPAANMAEMKMDMSGAAAVVGAFYSISTLKIQRHVIGLIPSVENMPGGNAMKPGDIIHHYNGKTSEVDNTDAEGRLILADALSYASKFNPDAVIDLATLTGAVVVALGHFATGMMGNDQKLMEALKEAGEKTYERVWQLPLFDEYEKLIKSDVADVKNVGGRWAGAITAGWFLKKFIGEYKWVHLDIAGTAILESDQEYAPKGGSGVGVRLLTEFLTQWKKS
jgi:leucyl aminopeptidase